MYVGLYLFIEQTGCHTATRNKGVKERKENDIQSDQQSAIFETKE